MGCVGGATARRIRLANVTHERVLDVCKALLVEPVLLDSIVDQIKRGVACDIGGARVAGEECEGSLPCCAFCPQLIEVLDGLAAQLLVGGRVRGDLDGIFDLQ